MGKSIRHWFTVVLCFVVLNTVLITGCSPEKTATTTTNNNSTTLAQANNLSMDNYVPRLNGTAVVEMTIKGSPVLIEVDGNNAPVTAGNFVDLVERGVYNGLTFHRVVTSPEPFVAQGGDPRGNGTGGFVDPATKKERQVPLEIKLNGQDQPLYGKAVGRQAGFSAPSVVLEHKRGAIAMARSQMPNSASSQFYFALSDLDFLDGDYAVFGHVTKGMETVDKIREGDKIDSAKVISGAENLKK
ncbi:peptidylprolyl isomerase [Aphanothece hegewaldii CCALA 016]|uniref:Peptidyl-prolyl cis-trans isomerase n=1 Tax=Aphanothece hegewaldii CCALA 016 TaxID=2107694 RepID=A0A2T1LVF7_9CHRO|nr:peptidylprolyl isomerase [Aphanothece hegewaldii]PSF35697.1 peptidylprolyl isomerase [Aphanothece hegewaldii CCALA 016]